MPFQKPPHLPLVFLTLSLMGLSLLPILITIPIISTIEFPYRTQTIGGIFIILCIFGIFAAIFPKQCRNVIYRRKQRDTSQDPTKSPLTSQAPTRQGHHPPCDHFTSHTLQVNNRIYCAGCTGLTIGALLAIITTMVYFFFGVFIGDPMLVFWVGFLSVILGLLQHSLYGSLKIQSGYFRVLMNVLFVAGSALLLISVDKILQSMEVDLYLFALILFWIYARISLSNRIHTQVCNTCGEEQCQFM